MGAWRPDELRCPCGALLALRRGDLWDIRHRGQRVLTPTFAVVGCPRCGQEVLGDAPLPRAVLVRGGAPVPWVERQGGRVVSLR